MQTIATILFLFIGAIIGLVGGMYLEQQYAYHHPELFCNVQNH